MKWLTVALAPMLAVAVGSAAMAGVVPPPDPVIGKWANPKNTLAVETGPCRSAGELCGAIVWASDRALADARDAGVPTLVGTQLLQGYRRAGQRDWTGRVYVPDMGRTFSSRISQTSPTSLTISGCLIGGFICKSQVWHRIA